MELIKCKYCESEFKPLTDRQIFCSASCRIKYGNAKQRSQMQGKVYEKVVKCAWCNNEFTRLSTSRKRYCSEDCKNTANKNKKNEALKEVMKGFRKSEKEKNKKPKLTITEINQKARVLHMSYGEYVSKYGVE